jgi:diphthamide biosynthesis methyltransferase
VENDELIEAQNGFRNNKSTDTASETFIQSIQEVLERGLHAIGLFFDLSKAHDVINHVLLLEKLMKVEQSVPQLSALVPL